MCLREFDRRALAHILHLLTFPRDSPIPAPFGFIFAESPAVTKKKPDRDQLNGDRETNDYDAEAGAKRRAEND